MKFNCLFLILILLLRFSSSAYVARGACSQEKLKLAECAEPHKAYVATLKKVTGHEILDREFMIKFSDFTKKLATCIGEVVCDTSRHYLFFLEALSYLIDGIYGDSYSCLFDFTQSDTSAIFDLCFIETETDYQTVRELKYQIHELLDCALKEMEKSSLWCTKESSQILQKSFIALRYIWQQYKEWIQDSMLPIVFDAKDLVLK